MPPKKPQNSAKRKMHLSSLAIITSIMLLAACGGVSNPVYETRWVNNEISSNKRQRHLDYCHLEASYAESEWLNANPLEDYGYGWQGIGVTINQMRASERKRYALGIYHSAISVCLRDKDFEKQRKCVEHCEQIQ